MKRYLSLLTLVALVAVGSRPQMTLALHVQRTSFDLLDVIGVQLVVDNTTAKPLPIAFSGPQEYVISIRRESGDVTPVFALPVQTPPPGATIAGHTRSLQPGANVLATFEWNELTDTRTSLAPGRYIVEARVLGGQSLVASAPVTFVAPVPVSAIAKLKPAAEITVAGHLEAGGARLTDATGSVALSRHLTVPVAATVAIRGAISVDPDGTRSLTVERWARLP